MVKIKDKLKWVAAACALVATASAEYELARAIGMNPWVALAVPGALDAYVVRALRAHREVLTSVLAMVGVNAVSHLLTAGVLVLDWRIITAVSAIAPLVLWRVHALGTPDTVERFDSDTGEYYQARVSEPEPWIDDDTDTPSRWDRFYGGPPVSDDEHGPGSFDAHVSTVPGVSDLTVPEEWTQEAHQPVSVLPTDPFPEDTPERAQACAVVSLPLPAGFEHAVPSEADTAKAIEHGEWYEEYVSKHGSTPSLRTVKAECSVSTDRARRLLNIWGDA